MKLCNGLAPRWVATLAVAVAITAALLVGSTAAATAATGAQDRAVPAAPSTPTVYSITLGSGPFLLDAFEGGGLMGFYAYAGAPEGNRSQRWVVLQQTSDVYLIHQLSTGRVLDAWYGNYATTTLYQGNDSQKWRIHHWGGGFVSFQQVSSGLYLQSVITSPSWNLVTVAPWSGANSQVWRLT